jgi:hypothetical protein
MTREASKPPDNVFIMLRNNRVWGGRKRLRGVRFTQPLQDEHGKECEQPDRKTANSAYEDLAADQMDRDNYPPAGRFQEIIRLGQRRRTNGSSPM